MHKILIKHIQQILLCFVGTSAASFAIDASTAAITTTAVFDYESGTTSYGGTLATLAVKVVDSGGASATVPITITVNDINDAPTFGSGSYTGSVDEEQASGATVALGTALSTNDEDTDTITYSLVGMYKNSVSYFKIFLPFFDNGTHKLMRF